MDKINIKGVPAVTSLKVEGEGMKVYSLVVENFRNLSQEQQEAMIVQAFVKTLDMSIAKGTNEGLIELLQHCNLFPSTIPENEKEEWARRAFLFRTAYDRIVASLKPVPSKKGKTERRDWKNPVLLNKLLDAVKASKTGTFKDIGETFGGLEPSQVMSVLEGLRTGKYAGVGFPAKEYDIHLPRQKGRKASA